ncbi:MAG: sorbosone dehydrogenase [Alphaproteobacteria bacterium]|nr:sorbosone dehydrogenase [Alphaproteobacteria bacterium]
MYLRIATLALLMIAAAAPARADQDLPLDELKLPDGFHISVWAHVDGARSMAVGDGFVVVGTLSDAVYAVPFDRRTYAAGKLVKVTDDLKVPNGVALLDGVLYIAEQPRLVRWGNAPFSLSAPRQKPVQIGPDLVDKPHHGWRYLTAGPDGKLYVTIGSPCNVCMPEGLQGSILRIDPASGKTEKIATGIRNSVGLAFRPGSRDIYFTDNGVDMMGDNVPPDELNRLTRPGQNFGFPWYGGGRARTKEFGNRQPPAGVQFPVVEFAAHSANLGLLFYRADMFPAAYRSGVFVAEHGSWNRTFPIGYRLMYVTLNQDGSSGEAKVFASGWLDRGRAWGRPVDVKQLPDGSILVSDDFADVIYRITYGR